MNNRGEGELRPWDHSMEGEITHLLRRLNGTERYSFLIWKLPEGKGLFDVAPDDPASRVYMQCAGAYDGRMTAEIRELVEGQPHQYVLGRGAEADEHAEADQVVPWNDHEAHVRPNEVLTGPEVNELFLHYFRNGTEPPEFVRREIVL